MGNKEEKTGSKQAMSVCCSQAIHPAHGGCSAGILKMAVEHLPPKRRIGVGGHVVYSKATALLLKQKMSQMYFFFFLCQVLVVFPLISVDPGYPSYSLFSFYFLDRWFHFVNAAGKLILFHPLSHTRYSC